MASWQEQYRQYNFDIPQDANVKEGWGGALSNYKPGQTIQFAYGSPEFRALINTGAVRESLNIPAIIYNSANEIATSGAGYKDLKVLKSSEGNYAATYVDPTDGSVHSADLESFMNERNISLKNKPDNADLYKAGESPLSQWNQEKSATQASVGQYKNNQQAANVDPAVLAKPGIADLVMSGKAFNETDAKNFAYAKGDQNWQQYVGGVNGEANPNYIGSTNWASLQKQYTPYQLQQATIRTANGIYWNPNVNIANVPRVDPATAINDDTKKIAGIVSDAKKTADKFSSGSGAASDKPTVSSDADTNEKSLMAMLTNQYGDSAETVYNKLFNTPEMNAAKSDVIKYKNELEDLDDQIDDLKSDVRSEVEGEASESYITALATVRGEKILKQKRLVQRQYDTALAQYNGLKENATQLLHIRTADSENRYNRLFQMLQLQIQQEGTKFNQETALAQIAMQIPEGRSMVINGQTVKGLKENDNLNVVQFTDASGKTYVIGVDKKTGQQTYKTYIGQSKVAGSGTTTPTVGLDEALYWLSLSKDKDGNPDLSKIPEKYRSAVVQTMAANKDKMPAPEKSWWERQQEDLGSGDWKSIINPFD